MRIETRRSSTRQKSALYSCTSLLEPLVKQDQSKTFQSKMKRDEEVGQSLCVCVDCDDGFVLIDDTAITANRIKQIKPKSILFGELFPRICMQYVDQ